MTASPRSSSSRFAIILGFAGLVFFVFAFGLRFIWFFGEAQLPALLQGLPDSKTEADQQVFLARLGETFPAGAAAAGVAATLSQQGFKLGPQGQNAATYDRQAGLKDKCRYSANVHWSADAQGQVSDVTGGYYQHCPSH